MKKYLDEVGLADFATKLTQKYKSIFAARGEAGTPIPVETVAEMTDEEQIYVYTGTETGYTAGDWYYYDGSAWVSGGSYGAGVTDDTLTIEGRAADAKATGDAIRATQSMIAGRESSYTATRNYSVGDLVIVSDALYRVTAAIASGETITPGTNVTADTVSEELAALEEGKADKDGTILNAVNAEQITAKTRVSDEKPYVFRAAGGGAEIGDRAFIDKIVGGTVVWNQIVDPAYYPAVEDSFTNGVKVSAVDTAKGIVTIEVDEGGATDDRSIYLLGITSDIPPANRYTLKSSHKYLWMGCPEGGSSETYRLGISGTYADVGKGYVLKDYSSGYIFSIRVMSGCPAGTYMFEPRFYDLTQMFGADIADYLFTLNNATPGAAKAWFNRHGFSNSPSVDRTGTLRSVNAAAHKTVGFNAWDEEWELGAINSSGEKVPSNDIIRSKNYIPIIPGTTYYANLSGKNARIAFYDAGMAFISYVDKTGDGTFTTPENACYMLFHMNTAYGTTYGHNLCFNLHWDGERDGEYEPYSAHTYALDDSLTLYGIPKLDANNALYYDGDWYAPDGTVTRRAYAVKSSNCTITKAVAAADDYRWQLTIPSGAPSLKKVLSSQVVNAKTSEYFEIVSKNDVKSNTILENTWYKMGEIDSGAERRALYFTLDSSTIQTLEAAQTWVSQHPFTLWYETVESTEAAAPYTSPQIVDNWGTEEYTDAGVAAGTRDVAIPVGHETEYPPNLRAKLEAAPDSPDADGDYIMRRSGGANAYAALTKELPSVPGEDGTYVLKCTVSGGTATLSWVSES